MEKNGPRSRKIGALVMAATAMATGIAMSRHSQGETPCWP